MFLVYYRALVNFTDSLVYGPELEDIYSSAFIEISEAVVDTVRSVRAGSPRIEWRLIRTRPAKVRLCLFYRLRPHLVFERLHCMSDSWLRTCFPTPPHSCSRSTTGFKGSRRSTLCLLSKESETLQRARCQTDTLQLRRAALA